MAGRETAGAPPPPPAGIPAAASCFPLAGDRAERLRRICQDLVVGLLMALILVLPFARARWTRSALLVAATVLWAARWLLGGRPVWRRTPLDWPIASFAAWALLSALASIRPLYSLEKFGQEPLSYSALFYLVVVHVRSERDHRRILDWLAVGLLIMASYGLWEWSRPWHPAAEYIRSFTAGGTYIGAYLAAAIPVAAAQTMAGGAARRGWWWLVTGVGVLCLVPTYSRAAWAGVAIALVLLAVTTARWLWVLLGLAGAAGPFLFGPEVIVRFLALADPAYVLGDTSTMDRVPIWKYSLHRMMDHPVLGFGFGRQIPAIPLGEGYSSGELVVQGGRLGYAHNTFLDVGLQMGFVGLVLLVWLLAVALVALWRAWRSAPAGYPRAVTAGVLAMALAFPVRAMTNNYFADDPVILFWFLVALALAVVPGSPFPVPGSHAESLGTRGERPGTGNREPATGERSCA